MARELSRKWEPFVVERDHAGGSAAAEKEDIRASGLLGLTVPTRFGGLGADWPTALEVVREFARADGSLGHLFGYHISLLPFIELVGSPRQQERLLGAIAKQRWWVGNASSENNSNVLDWKVSATATPDGGYLLNGTKHFSSGAKGSDLLLVFAVTKDDSSSHDEAIVTAAIPTQRDGVVVNDDWQAIGQRRTDSGTTEFHDAKIEPEEVLGKPNAVIEAFAAASRPSIWTPLIQLVFANVYLGIAHGALDAARHYTTTAARPWPTALAAGVTRAADDPYVIRTYGEFGIQLQAADAAARETARLLQQIWDKDDAVTPEDRGELMVRVSGVKALATKAGLDVASGIFEVIGARGTHPNYGFDRFWRNVRTHTLHDPVAYKIADVGNYVLNGRYPVPTLYS
ncbi:acyl-CoA dehydrogenase family protein [Candidatus Mycolicibacterium alkanivorans]|uniref:Dibenzothiophene monooxygenase n=1 Tax=Candidatus Mycolicibacterium alkanivorans TaxID=2954114 RepID=A0ABS9YXK2_9MYCO|nr:acyl-CoA dehydrogenase family protein [Candidatus Mycolicibacterium alkanivorans]MCI4675931.1 acyl-CoA dehydrogenase family protein [Candidatus Mycolicibacterium alkanivorans]